MSANQTLSSSTPNADGSERCGFDPLDPVLTHGGAVYWGHAEQLGYCLGPVDQRKLLKRPDVLYFRGEPVGKSTSVVGEAKLDITVATDAGDMDVIAKLWVEQPDGAVVILALGQLRCRFRESFAAPNPMKPGEPTPVTLRFHPIAYQFPPGSRVGLIVTFSDFPRIEPNPGFVAAPFSGATPRKARHTVFHGPMSRSRLKLPWLER